VSHPPRVRVCVLSRVCGTRLTFFLSAATSRLFVSSCKKPSSNFDTLQPHKVSNRAFFATAHKYRNDNDYKQQQKYVEIRQQNVQRPSSFRGDCIFRERTTRTWSASEEAATSETENVFEAVGTTQDASGSASRASHAKDSR
jgi:hypothetical protein